MDKIENVGTIPQKYVYFSVDRLQWDSFSVKRHLICRKVSELLTVVTDIYYLNILRFGMSLHGEMHIITYHCYVYKKLYTDTISAILFYATRWLNSTFILQ